MIAGGHHATAMPELTLKKIPGLDHVAAGEAEYIMMALTDGQNPARIPGLFSRHSVISPSVHEQIKNLDGLPLPDFEIFDMDYYTKLNRFTINSLYLKTASILIRT